MKHNNLCISIHPVGRCHIISTVESATCMDCMQHSAPSSDLGGVIKFVATDIFPGCFHNKLLTGHDLILA